MTPSSAIELSAVLKVTSLLYKFLQATKELLRYNNVRGDAGIQNADWENVF